MPPLLHTALVDASTLSRERTVPRAWVHKRSLDNVLLTEVRACAADEFICAGRLPTAHCFFNDIGRTPHTDILFYTEIGRQASLAVSHAFLDVSTDDVFIFEGSEAAVGPAVWTRSRPSVGDAVVIHIRAADITRRKNNAVARLVTEHAMMIGGEHVFTGTGAFTIQPAALFQRLRRGSPVASDTSDTVAVVERAARVPRASGHNVAISTPRATPDGAREASLIVDRAHSYFFDHACDHVPGMLLLEGCAQLAVMAFTDVRGIDASGISAYEANFTKFVEGGIPATLTARLDAEGHPRASDAAQPAVDIAVTQQGAVCGTMRMRLALPATH
jgi:hypothetical protein